jgi:hypothetical protein
MCGGREAEGAPACELGADFWGRVADFKEVGEDFFERGAVVVGEDGLDVVLGAAYDLYSAWLSVSIIIP